ncbi:MAG: hypothetical protein DWQ19_12030 [Crenarchaeota archaeon]|nr:MAG: hypothetical protein DWQ19_12030 [Thermoproteota archaeon]
MIYFLITLAGIYFTGFAGVLLGGLFFELVLEGSNLNKDSIFGIVYTSLILAATWPYCLYKLITD